MFESSDFEAGHLRHQMGESAKLVYLQAQRGAISFNHNYIGTEHLLWGATFVDESTNVLSSLNAEPEEVRKAVEFVIGRGDQAIDDDAELSLTPRAKKVVELSVDEARKMNELEYGAKHLLLGLASEGGGIAAGVLESFGLNLLNLRSGITKMGQTPMEQATAQVERAAGLTTITIERLQDFLTRLDESNKRQVITWLDSTIDLMEQGLSNSSTQENQS